MATIVSGTLRAALRKPGDQLNVLTFCTHESVQTSMSATNCHYFLFRGPGLKDWNATFRPLPPNFTLLDPGKGERQLPPDVVFDVVLSQNRLGVPASQYQIAESLSRSLHVPHVALEHTLPHPRWSIGQVRRLRDMAADVNVFIGDYQRTAWGWHEGEAIVIEHGIDTDLFKPPGEDVTRRPVLLSVVNDWINRDAFCGFEFWKAATNRLPVFPVGDTPGLSSPARTVGELVWYYQTSRIFVNTSQVSPVPTSLLEAMACGCAVVSTDTCMIPGIIEEGVNGYRTNKPGRFRELCEMLLADPDECRRLGRGARETVVERFGLGRFVSDWERVLGAAASIIPFGGR